MASSFWTNAGKAATFAAEFTTAISFAAAASLYVYNTWWLANKTEVSAYIVQSTPTIFSIYVANEGGTDVVVRSLGITSDLLKDINFKAKLPPGGQMVEHGKSSLITSAESHLNAAVQTDPETMSKRWPNQSINTTTCAAHLAYVDSKGRRGERSLPFTCYAASIFPVNE